MSIQTAPPVITALAQDIVDELMKSQPAQLDPLAIAALIQIVAQVISAVVKMMQACGMSSEEALEAARDPGVFTRVRVNLAFRTRLPAKFTKYRDSLASATLRAFATRPPEAAAALYAAGLAHA